jgi:hypothetical protein
MFEQHAANLGVPMFCAICNDAAPILKRASTVAPRSSSMRQISMCPFCAAIHNGVAFSLVRESLATPYRVACGKFRRVHFVLQYATVSICLLRGHRRQRHSRAACGKPRRAHFAPQYATAASNLLQILTSTMLSFRFVARCSGRPVRSPVYNAMANVVYVVQYPPIHSSVSPPEFCGLVFFSFFPRLSGLVFAPVRPHYIISYFACRNIFSHLSF